MGAFFVDFLWWSDFFLDFNQKIVKIALPIRVVLIGDVLNILLFGLPNIAAYLDCFMVSAKERKKGV